MQFSLSKEESDRETGYWYDLTRQRQKREYENVKKAEKMRKRIDKVSRKTKIIKRK